jgi:hypothetical protein
MYVRGLLFASAKERLVEALIADLMAVMIDGDAPPATSTKNNLGAALVYQEVVLPVPSPKVIPWSFNFRTSHIPEPKLTFDSGQCEIEVPVLLRRFISSSLK